MDEIPWKLGDRVAVPTYRKGKKRNPWQNGAFKRERFGTIERISGDAGIGHFDVWIRFTGDRNPHRYSGYVGRFPFRPLSLLEQIADASSGNAGTDD